MAKKKQDYFGLGRVISLILAIIPVTSLIFGIAARIQDKHYVAAVIRLFFGWNIFWILDLIFMIVDGHILRLLEA